MKKADKALPNDRLRRERERRGWTREFVAEQIDCPEAKTVGRWERGITSPGPHYRQKLCELFEKSAEEMGLLKQVVESAWNIPYRRNSFFTGREDILQFLHDTFTAQKATLAHPLVISGMGGIGKTQTAIEYAYRYRDDYSAVLWARADNRETLISDFVVIAALLNLPEKDERDQGRTVAALLRELGSSRDWLLILDNADDLAIARDFIPVLGKGHVLLTTRAQVTGTIAQRIELEKMEPEVGALLLARRAKLITPNAPLDAATDNDQTKAKTIVEDMDGLPLAIDQAAAYIEEAACGLSGYLERYQTQRARLLKQRGGVIEDHPDSVAATLSMAFERVQNANPAAAELLRLCAFLHPDAIPEEIITVGALDLGSSLEPVATDPLALDAAIQELRTYSLIRRDPDARLLVIHRLVQAVLKDAMDENTQRQWVERTVRAVNRAFPEVEFKTWKDCQRCLPHAQACAVLIDEWKMDFPETASLLDRTGLYLQERAQYEQAGLFFQQALAIRERSSDPEIATSLSRLARFYHIRGKFAEAELLYRKALSIREQVLGSEHAATASILNNLGGFYCEQGKFDQGEPLFRQALAIRERVLGLEHPDTVTNISNLGTVYCEQGNFALAEPLLKQALSIREKMLGPKHPYTLAILNNLAVILYRQRKYDETEPLFRRVVEMREQVLGPEHPDTGESFGNLGELYTEQGKFAEAEPLLKRALGILEKILGPEHRLVAQPLGNLAEVSYARGHYAQAENFYRRALAIWEETSWLDQPEVSRQLRNYANLLRQMNRDTEAAELEERIRINREHNKKSLDTDTPENTLESRP